MKLFYIIFPKKIQNVLSAFDNAKIKLLEYDHRIVKLIIEAGKENILFNMKKYLNLMRVENGKAMVFVYNYIINFAADEMVFVAY